MQLRRRLLLTAPAVLLLPPRAHAQAGPGFVGEWQGAVPGVADARLVISAVRQTGQVEGRMEFSPKGLVTTFGDKADTLKSIIYGVVSGLSLRIETGLGGTYTLRREGDSLNGTYARGTTYKVPVVFERAS